MRFLLRGALVPRTRVLCARWLASRPVLPALPAARHIGSGAQSPRGEHAIERVGKIGIGGRGGQLILPKIEKPPRQAVDVAIVLGRICHGREYSPRL